MKGTKELHQLKRKRKGFTTRKPLAASRIIRESMACTAGGRRDRTQQHHPVVM